LRRGTILGAYEKKILTNGGQEVALQAQVAAGEVTVIANRPPVCAGTSGSTGYHGGWDSGEKRKEKGRRL